MKGAMQGERVTYVYDSSIRVPDDVHALTGIERFGAMIVHRQRLADAALAAARAAGCHECLHVRTEGELRLVAERIADAAPNTRVLYQSSRYALGEEESRAALQALMGAEAACGYVRGGALLLGMPDIVAGHWLANEYRHGPPPCTVLPDDPAALDLCAPADLAEMLGRMMLPRAFNQLRQHGAVVEKSSRDRAKIRAEFEMIGLLPDELRAMFVQPFDFHDDGAVASYRMERLNVPDMGLQWVHDALDPEEFSGFLERVSRWFERRPLRHVGAARAADVARELYVDKVLRRADAFEAMPACEAVDRYLSARQGAGFRALVTRCIAAVERVSRAAHLDALAMSHGDPCLSNILYDKRVGLLRFIDPRGALDENALYMDAYYDVAKLSHSILGDYDYLHQGLFDLALDDALSLELRLNRGVQFQQQRAFRDRVAAWGFDLPTVRAYEASLFVSMAPLHADAPRRVVALLLNAERILTELGR